MPSHRAQPSRRAKRSRQKPSHLATGPGPRTPSNRLTIGLLGAAIVAGTLWGASPGEPAPTHPDLAVAADRALRADRASRSFDRIAPVPETASATPLVAATPTQSPTASAPPSAMPVPTSPAPSPKPKAATPARTATPAPKPTTTKLPVISGLSAAQVRNANTIVQVGRSMGVSIRGQIIAIATALQESNLLNLTVAVDHDSLGLFQQRPSAGWGTPAQLTDPAYAARKFYQVLLQYTGDWGCLTCAAQRVQVSAFPNAYAKHETLATKIVNALN